VKKSIRLRRQEGGGGVHQTPGSIKANGVIADSHQKRFGPLKFRGKSTTSHTNSRNTAQTGFERGGRYKQVTSKIGAVRS